MLKRYIWLAVATVFFTFQMFVSQAFAVELDQASRTVALDDSGKTVVVSVKDLEKGKRLFINACSQCHVGGKTRTNPNVNLGPESLAGALPRRDNIEGLVDYMKNPTSYDGFVDIAEFHPSIESADLYPQMRNLSEDDLYTIAAHILVQPNILGKMWGGGKVYN